jgi:hypothetical protein
MPWVTINGEHILIGEGESVKEAFAKRKQQASKDKQTKGETPARKLTAKEKADRLSKGKPLTGLSEKALRAQATQNKTDAEVQQYTKANEFAFAKRLGGDAKAFDDNGPTDIEMTHGGKLHGFEVKTLTHGKNDRVNMKPDALERKFDWETANTSKMHAVILDHRDKFAEGRNADIHSGHEIYYKRGLGNLRIGAMMKVRDEDHLKELMTTPYKNLPKQAQGIIRPHEIRNRIT